MFFVLAASVALLSAVSPRTNAAQAVASANVFAPPAPISIGSDLLSFPGTEHATAVGPVIATNGFATVSVFQTGRYFGDASDAMGFTTSYGDGFRFSQSLLPGLTKAQSATNPYDRITFASIVYNARYDEFLVSMLPISNVPSNGDADTTLPPIVQRSIDGVHWTAPTVTSPGGIRPEKNFIACDDYSFSARFGTCYVVWDDGDNGGQFHANVSTDGGKTWGPTRTAVDAHFAYGAVPVVLPNGTVVVTSEDGNGYDGGAYNVISSVSTDGGTTWSAAYEISPLATHKVAGSLRTQALPTTVVDNGTIYTVWQDCRFRSGCSSNDLVMSESTDGVHWSSPARLPLDAVTSGVDHFLPTIAIRDSFFGSTIGVSYYEYPQANCTVATCQLDAMFADSGNGGASFSTPDKLYGPMNVTWLATTSAGYMVGDYFTATFPQAYEAPIAVAGPPGATNDNESIAIVPWGFFGYGLDAARRGAPATAASHMRGLGAGDGAALHVGAMHVSFRSAALAPRVRPAARVRHGV